jgi:glycosyltransferase involved in cell wall biosynthesis
MNCKFACYSVVITTYNSSNYIRKALDSVFSQSIQPSEVIVVDDCSTDNTIESISSYPIKIIESPVNMGTSYARNLGLSAVQNEFTFMLDADDYWDTNLASDHMETWNNCESQMIALGSHLRIKYEAEEKSRFKFRKKSPNDEPVEEFSWYELAQHNPFFASATSFRTSKLRDVGGWTIRPHSYCEDYELLAKILISGYKIGMISNVNGTYLVRESNKSSQLFEVFKSELKVMELLFVSHRKASPKRWLIEYKIVSQKYFSQIARIFRQKSFIEIIEKDELFEWLAKSKWLYVRPFALKLFRILLYFFWRIKIEIRGRLPI